MVKTLLGKIPTQDELVWEIPERKIPEGETN